MLSNYSRIGQVVLQLYRVIMRQLLVSNSCQFLHHSNVTHSTAQTCGRVLEGNYKQRSSNTMRTLYYPSGFVQHLNASLTENSSIHNHRSDTIMSALLFCRNARCKKERKKERNRKKKGIKEQQKQINK